MTIMRLFFTGEIKKAEHRMAGDKPIVEVSLCKKFKEKDADDSFTWVRITLWQPAEFQVAKLVKGGFIAGSGEFKLRSYKDKDGNKAVSAEIRCTSFDVEVSDGPKGDVQVVAAKPVTPSRPTVRPTPDDDQVPF